jgi:hypothetical protein
MDGNDSDFGIIASTSEMSLLQSSKGNNSNFVLSPTFSGNLILKDKPTTAMD